MASAADKVTLVSMDQKKFTVPKRVAQLSGLVSSMIEDGA